MIAPAYDVVVVGAGPSGTTLARAVAREGYSVLVLEKDRDVGIPVRCGEAVSNRSLETVVDIDPRWIATTIRRFRLVAPDGTMVEPDLGGHGYVLERRIFDYDLARLAAEAGAQIVTKAYVDGLLPEEPDQVRIAGIGLPSDPGLPAPDASANHSGLSAAEAAAEGNGSAAIDAQNPARHPATTRSTRHRNVSAVVARRHSGVTFEWNGERRSVRARIIVGADGVESRVARWAGIDSTTHLRDMECCAQMTIAGVHLDDDACEFHFGRAIAPMGYLWMFPKGNGMANVGLGISGLAARERSALSLLRSFVERRFPGAGVLTTVAGGVPCAPTLERLVRGNVVLVGDAAHQVNPMSGGGITSGMIGATHAAAAICQALRAGDERHLAAYERSWEKAVGAKHRTYHRMKEAVYRFPDETLNGIAHNVLALRPDKRTIWGVFRVALVHHPALIWDMVRTFGLKG